MPHVERDEYERTVRAGKVDELFAWGTKSRTISSGRYGESENGSDPLNSDTDGGQSPTPQGAISWGSVAHSELDDIKSASTNSTATRSQQGATWSGAIDQTINTGFGSSTRRTMNGRGVREGRERELFRSTSIPGVGRTGKRPAPVPKEMQRALGVVVSEDEEESSSATTTDTEDTTDDASVRSSVSDGPKIIRGWFGRRISLSTRPDERGDTPTYTDDSVEDASSDSGLEWPRHQGKKGAKSARNTGMTSEGLSWFRRPRIVRDKPKTHKQKRSNPDPENGYSVMPGWTLRSVDVGGARQDENPGYTSDSSVDSRRLSAGIPKGMDQQQEQMQAEQQAVRLRQMQAQQLAQQARLKVEAEWGWDFPGETVRLAERNEMREARKESRKNAEKEKEKWSSWASKWRPKLSWIL